MPIRPESRGRYPKDWKQIVERVREHCDLANLRHWCQRCHLVYDRDHHAQTRAATKRAAAATAELFEA